jgi:hypothetical protein
MQIFLLVELVPGSGYRASSGEPFGLSAEGATREEAITKVKHRCEDRLNGGAEVVTVELGPAAHAWLRFAGMFKDDPGFEELLKILAENQRRMDEDPETL